MDTELQDLLNLEQTYIDEIDAIKLKIFNNLEARIRLAEENIMLNINTIGEIDNEIAINYQELEETNLMLKNVKKDIGTKLSNITLDDSIVSSINSRLNANSQSIGDINLEMGSTIRHVDFNSGTVEIDGEIDEPAENNNNIQIIEDVILNIIDEKNPLIKYTGNWESAARPNSTVNGSSKVSGSAGDIAEFTFIGDFVSVFLEYGIYSGIAEITLDGYLVELVDCYIDANPGFTFPVFEKKIPYGKHTIKIRNTGNYNPLSASLVYLNSIMFHQTKTKSIKPFQPGVVLTFDDSRDTFYSKSAPMLAEKGWAATAFINPGNIDKINGQSPRINYYLAALKRYGWEISSHSYTHTSLITLSKAQIEKEILDSINYLKSNNLEYSHFVLPYGDTNIIVDEVLRKYHSSVGLVSSTPNSFNPNDFDPYAMPRYQLDSNTNLTTFENYIDYVVKNNLTTVLCLHGVSDGGIAPNMSVEMFQSIVDILEAKKANVMRMKDFFGA